MDLLQGLESALPGGAASGLPATRLLRVERAGNPLRRFGYVSPHIGKIAPLDAGALYRIARLAAAPPGRASDPVSGPTLVIGMAESALLLAWFLAARLGDRDVDLRFTTRECREARGRRIFLEPHSHGPVHSLALPAGSSYGRVVVVEDELTTGATLRNLLLEIRDVSPRHHVVTLADGRPPSSRERLREEMGALGVELSVTDLSESVETPLPAPPDGRATPRAVRNPFGRPDEVLDRALDSLRRSWLSLRPLCLYAIGECVDVTMMLWESLPPEERPVFRHVTRSPWLVDGGAIASRLDLQAPPAPRHFLYNWTEEAAPPRALLVGEQSTAPVARQLRRFLRSRGVEAEAVEVSPA